MWIIGWILPWKTTQNIETPLKRNLDKVFPPHSVLILLLLQPCWLRCCITQLHSESRNVSTAELCLIGLQRGHHPSTHNPHLQDHACLAQCMRLWIGSGARHLHRQSLQKPPAPSQQLLKSPYFNEMVLHLRFLRC